MTVSARRSSRLNLRHFIKSFPVAIFFAIALLFTQTAAAQVLFEGYSKVMLDGTHVGYVVQRFEFDSKKKEFSTTYLLKTGANGGNITESLKARSTESLKPIAYQYTSLTGTGPTAKTETIDATFKGDTMTAVMKKSGKPETTQKKIPKDAFLASFLGYMMLQGKEGIKKGVNYAYKGIAEEDGIVYPGKAFISGEETINGVSAFKVLNNFKNADFASWVTAKGEVLVTRSPIQKIATELVGSVQEATAGQSVNTSSLTLLFGSFPKGEENVLARRESAGGATKTALPAKGMTKKDGVPQGQGVMVKGAPSKPAALAAAPPTAAAPTSAAVPAPAPVAPTPMPTGD